MLSSAILFSGSLPSHVLQLLEYMNCKAITTRTFFKHQKRFLQPAVMTLWTTRQSEYIDEAKQNNRSIVLGGDGRADSPGFSAKYGSYTTMDLDLNVISHISLVQVI